MRFAPLIGRGEVLDLACGTGRHARVLAASGHAVLAVDRDLAALSMAAGEGITTLQVDLELSVDPSGNWLFSSNRFAAVVVTNYLHRPLFPYIFDSLAPGGVLLYETFAEGNAQFGKPSNPDFLLTRGELLKWVIAQSNDSMRVVAFEDSYVDLPKPAVVQRICAIKLSHEMTELSAAEIALPLPF